MTAGARTPPAAGGDTSISLAAEEKAKTNNLSIYDQINYNTFELKARLARKLIQIFIGTNLFVACLVAFLAWLDWHMINLDPKYAEHRMIDHTVIMTLIGATTVQVGVIALSLFGSLFPRGGGGDG